jgi:hypothetical protein
VFQSDDPSPLSIRRKKSTAQRRRDNPSKAGQTVNDKIAQARMATRNGQLDEFYNEREQQKPKGD